MELTTKHFGVIEIDESAIVNFNDGLPGFEKLKRFAVLDKVDNEVPFNWLQSIDDTDIAFVIIDPFFVMKEYEIDVDDEEVDDLEISDLKDVLVYAIVVVPKEVKEMTVNLKAPIIINVNNKRGKQVVLHKSDYDVRYKIYDGLGIAKK